MSNPSRQAMDWLRYQERRAAGLCVKCQAPTNGASARCPACAAVQKASLDKRRADKLARGECLRCKSPADPGSVHCVACRARSNEVTRDNKMVHNVQWMREGRCHQCGREQLPGKFLCQLCLDKSARGYVKRKVKCQAEKICVQCSTPLPKDHEFLRCDRCRENNNLLSKSYRTRDKRAAT